MNLFCWSHQLAYDTTDQNDEFDNEFNVDTQYDRECLNYFLELKKKYEDDRGEWEGKWRNARDLYFNNNKIDKVYEGRSNIRVPIIDSKVNGVTSRINRSLFSSYPFGRIESPQDKVARTLDEKIVELWNKFIFEYQINEIGFVEEFKNNQKNKIILGTSIAKITNEYEVKEFSYFDDEEEEEVVVKDNTYYRPLLLEEFYTDLSKERLYDSLANIHSTTISMEDLRADAKRKEKVIESDIEESNWEDNEIGIFEETEKERVRYEEKGTYYNLNLIELQGNGLTTEQTAYLQNLGLGEVSQQAYEKKLKDQKKTGIIDILECWGLYDIDDDGKPQECVVTIANGHVIIRKEKSPFRHIRYNRPFIAGKYKPISGCFYGESNVIKSYNLIQELNAARAQMVDAKTRSISPMWYQNTDMNIQWDKTWRPNGLVKGQGQGGLAPILNPYLGNVTSESIVFIERDLDKLWSQSPVQEGSTDSRLVPKTASGTAMVIQQNDIPLNEIIVSTIEREIKPFLEMIFERNLQFKTEEDLLKVWNMEELQNKGLVEEQQNPETGQIELVPTFSMKDMVFRPIISVLGTVELNNEQAHQVGYRSLFELSQVLPPLAKRIDYRELTERFLRSFGIKEDSEGLFYSEAEVQEAEQEMQQQQQQQESRRLQEEDQMRMMITQLDENKKDADMQREITKAAEKYEAKADSDIEIIKQKAILERAYGVNI